MELLSITENRYSGIPTIRKALQKADLPEPEFRVIRGIFSVTFRNKVQELSPGIDKSDIRKAVIQFCTVPRSRAELTAFTGKSRYYTMAMIIKPLLEQGKLRMTIPDKPKSSYQRFVTTE